MAHSTYYPSNTPGNVDNILATIASASPDQRCAGLNWYSFAYYECARIGQDYNLPPIVACAVTALLSPAKRWSLNIHHAKAVIDTWSHGYGFDYVPSFVNSVGSGPTKKALKALDIWRYTKDYEPEFWNGAVQSLNPNGRKVPAFFANLTNPDSPAVTVDSHAFGIWAGFTHKGTFQFQNLYLTVESAYQEAGRILGLTPSQAQAIAWVVRTETTMPKRKDF